MEIQGELNMRKIIDVRKENDSDYDDAQIIFSDREDYVLIEKNSKKLYIFDVDCEVQIDTKDIDNLIKALEKAKEILKKWA